LSIGENRSGKLFRAQVGDLLDKDRYGFLLLHRREAERILSDLPQPVMAAIPLNDIPGGFVLGIDREHCIEDAKWQDLVGVFFRVEWFG
jgi:hypothetical protein